MELFGYVCSIYCRDQAERQKMRLSVYKHQRAVVQQKARTQTRLVIAACGLLFVAFVGAWTWYAFIGSHPKVVCSQKIPKGDRARFYELLAPHDVLSVSDGEMVLYDAAQQRQVWSTKVKTETATNNSEGALDLSSMQNSFADDMAFGASPRVVITTNDIWLLFADHIEQHDRKTGGQKQNVPLKEPVISLEQSDNSIVAVSQAGPGRETVTRIALPAGAVQTEQMGPEQTEQTTTGANALKMATVQVSHHNMPVSGFAGSPDSEGTQEYFADNAGVLQVNIRLLEHKIVTHEAMKPEGKSHLNNQLTANDSLEASQEILNDMRRNQTGGVVKEDISRYQIRLQRLSVKETPEWKGEVIGPPAFYSLKTVDVLTGGSSISVFDKNEKKLWDAKMTYSLPENGFMRKPNPPCVEAGDTLFVYDQGMLNAFDLLTGQVRWRLTSVGISKVQSGPQGNLYVDSTTASPDAIQFSQQIDIFKKARPVIMKVDPKTGKVLWRVERIAKDCFLSGKFVYASMSSSDPMAALNPSEPAAHYYNLYRLNPSNGNVMWHYYQSKWPVQFDAQGNWILLHFPDELQVLKFLSF